ncbi:MAG: band 7 protein, partial [Rubripirellula sp.]
LEELCETQGIEIIQALITRISPPQQIALPVRQRQIAAQQSEQYVKEIEQQLSEQNLIVEQELVKQKQALIAAEQEVVKLTVEAQRQQEVAVIGAEQRRKVAEVELAAAKDQADAITARGNASAEVINFENEAEAAGWKKSVEAYGDSGDEFARWVLLKKLAPSYRQLMVNTGDSPLMDIFSEFNPEVGKATTPESKSETKPKPKQAETKNTSSDNQDSGDQE